MLLSRFSVNALMPIETSEVGRVISDSLLLENAIKPTETREAGNGYTAVFGFVYKIARILIGNRKFRIGKFCQTIAERE